MYSFIYLSLHAHACCGTYVEARGQLMGAGSLPPPCGFEPSALQTWQQSPLPIGHLTSPLCNLNVIQARLRDYLCRQLCADLAPIRKRNPWAKDPEVH